MSVTTVYTIHVGLNTNGSPDFVTRNRNRLRGILDNRHFVGYTLVEGIGSYQGETEPTVMVSISSDDHRNFEFDAEYVRRTAEIIKADLGQEAVWVTRTNVDLLIV